MIARFLHGYVVGASTNSRIVVFRFSYSRSTRNSMIAMWLSADRAALAPKRSMVRLLPIARTQDRVASSANSSVYHVARRPVTAS